MTCDGQVGDLTCLVVVQGPSAQPLPTEALALHVVVHVSGASPWLLDLSECEKDGVTLDSAFSRGQGKLEAEEGHGTQEGFRGWGLCCLICAAQLSSGRYRSAGQQTTEELWTSQH